MKRMLLIFAVVSAVLTLPATAAAFRGVAVAKNPARHAIVVASRGGVVRTLRAGPARVRAVRLGRRLTISARKLSDGTFRAASLHLGSRVHHALIRGAVVRTQRRLHRLLISAGGSVFAVRTSRRFASTGKSGLTAGDRVELEVEIDDDGLRAETVKEVGQANTLELAGIFLGTTHGQLRLAVVHRGEVFIAVPAGFRLPSLRPGDEVEAIVAVSAGAFTLVSIQSDDENDDDDEGIDEDNGRVEVKGSITELAKGSISVTPRNASPVTCVFPPGTNLSAFKVNDRVEMRCTLVGTQLTLRKLEREDEGNDDEDDDQEAATES